MVRTVRDITENFTNVPEHVDIFWSIPQFKVILFVNGLPQDFINIDDSENTADGAVRAGRELIGRVKFV